MIYGIGIDIVRIERFRQVAERWGKRFLDRVFTTGELDYCYQKKNPYLSLAVRFAAKEAMIKAIGSAIPVPLTGIEVITATNGKPELKTTRLLEVFFRENSITKTHLSLSHEHEYGVACVILEQESA
jgi:holo-[acyl-carrier protein] synthase